MGVFMAMNNNGRSSYARATYTEHTVGKAGKGEPQASG